MSRRRRPDPTPFTEGGAHAPSERAAAALLSRLPNDRAPDDRAVERVWRAVTNPTSPARARPSFRLAWVACVAAAVVLIGVAGGSLFRSTPSVVEVTFSSGGVFAARRAEGWHASGAGERLAEADRLRTDPAGRALVRIGGVAAVLVGAGTDVDLERLARGTALRLASGTLTARVAKRRPGEPFVVEAGRYTVTVVGTLFTVEVGPSDRTAVSVREGIVEVSGADGRVHRVVAGARWTSDAPEAMAEDTTPDAVAALVENALTGRAGADLAAAFAEATTPRAAPVIDVPATTTAQVEPLDAGAASDAPPVVAKRRPAASGRTALVARVAPDVTPDVAAPPPPSSPSDADAGRADGADARVDPYAHGRELEALGDFEGAARELAKAADLDPRHGDLALYSLGRLEQRRLHHPARALAAFRRYRERYPQGTLLPEVDFEILQLDVEAHDRAGALAETARFLGAHPASERVEQVRLLRGNLLRDDGRCREALAEYAAVRAIGLADDALYSTAYCQRKLGDRAAAGGTLVEYLRKFPHGEHRAAAVRALESGREMEPGSGDDD
jgi:tetratricopeptide (TPR) repeat protein